MDGEVVARVLAPALSRAAAVGIALLVAAVGVVASTWFSPPADAQTATGQITIVVDEEPDGTTAFDFASTIPGGTTFSLSDPGDATLPSLQTFASVPAGIYTVGQTIDPLLTLSITCLDPDDGTIVDTFTGIATIDLDADEHVLCAFVNSGSISTAPSGGASIVKDTVPDSGQDFAFTFATGFTPSTFNLDDDTDPTLSNTEALFLFLPGTYFVAEEAAAGYDTTVSCVDPDGGSQSLGNVAIIEFDDGENITCTFTNTARGTITIIQDTVPDDPQDFRFESLTLSPTTFDLDDDTDPTLPNTQTFMNVAPGTYTITQDLSLSPGYSTFFACIDPDDGTPPGATTAIVDLDPGETVTCRFTSVPATPSAVVTIAKSTVPGDDPQDFEFNSTLSRSPFFLDDDSDPTLPDSQIFTSTPPGTYTVVETPVPGYVVTAIDCMGLASTPIVDLAAGSVEITVAAGEEVRCEFENTRLATITIVKDTVPDGPQDFSFTSNDLDPPSFTLDDDTDPTLSNTQTFTNVAPGTYEVTEVPITGYTVAVSCDDPTSDSSILGSTATIVAGPGESITCVFTNTAVVATATGRIIVELDSQPDSGDDVSFSAPDLDPPMFFLDDDADPTLANMREFFVDSAPVSAAAGTSTSRLQPGVYQINSAPRPGWITSVTCADPDGGTTTNHALAIIDLDAGETIRCVWTIQTTNTTSTTFSPPPDPTVATPTPSPSDSAPPSVPVASPSGVSHETLAFSGTEADVSLIGLYLVGAGLAALAIRRRIHHHAP